MKIKYFSTIIIVFLALIFLVRGVIAQGGFDPPLRSDEDEREIFSRLTGINPQAAPFFQMATQAMDAGDYSQARELYLEVLNLAPDFPDALRRLSIVELLAGEGSLAISYAEKAYHLDGKAESKAAFAAALFSGGSKNDIDRSLELAKEAGQESPDSGYINITLFEISVAVEDKDGLRIATNNLLLIAPENPLPHYFSALIAAEDSEWERALSELNQAEVLGMPSAEIEQAKQNLNIEENLRQSLQKQGMGRFTMILGVAGGLILLVGIAWEFLVRRRKKVKGSVEERELDK